MFDNDDEHDDIIRLFTMEQNKVFSGTGNNVIVFEDNSEDENTEFKVTSGLYKNLSLILPAAFYDIETNVELLERCRPLSIKLVDYNKFPRFYDKIINSNKDNHRNSKSLLEPDCIVDISSSDENDVYDIVVERKVSNDIVDINKEFDRARFISNSLVLETKSKNKQRNYTTTLEDKNESCNRVLEGYSPENFDLNSNMINLVSDNILQSEKHIQGTKEINYAATNKNNNVISKPCKRRSEFQIFSHYGSEETYIDKIDTYARLIDKANTNLQTKKPLIAKFETCEKEKYIYEVKPESHDTYKLDLKPKNIYQKNDKFEYDNISAEGHYIKYEDKKVDIDKNLYNSFGQYLGSDIYMKLYTNCEKDTKHIVDEVSQNNHPYSTVLPCPPHVNKIIHPNIKNVSPVTPLSLIKHKVEKECKKDVCTNKFYSANRVIPHYHHDTIRRPRVVLPSSVYRNSFRKSTTKVENMQLPVNNENKLCKGNEYFTDFCKIRQNKIVDSKFKDFCDISLNSLTSGNSDVPNMNRNKLTEESLGREVKTEYNSVMVSGTNNNSKYDFPEMNEIPVSLDKKPKNEIMSIFPFDSIISNQDDIESIEFSVNSNYHIAGPEISILNHNDIYPNNSNNNFCNPFDSHIDFSCTQILQASDEFYECKPLFKNGQDLVTPNELSQHPLGNTQIINTAFNNNHHIQDIKSTSHANDGNRYTSMSHFHDQLLGTRNMYRLKKTTTNASDNKYLTLKKHLEEVPLKLKSCLQGKSILRNRKSNKRIDKNQINQTQLFKKNINTTVARKNITLISDSSFHTDKEKVIAALVATDYMTEKAIKKEEIKREHIIESLHRPLQGMNVADIKNTANSHFGQCNDPHSYSLMSNDHSSPHDLIPRQQKTFHLLGKIKLYDLEKSKQLDSQKSLTEEEVMKKGSIKNKKSLLRKISINEYRQRQDNDHKQYETT